MVSTKLKQFQNNKASLAILTAGSLSGSAMLVDELWPSVTVWPLLFSSWETLELVGFSDPEEFPWCSPTSISWIEVTSMFESVFDLHSMLTDSDCSCELVEHTLWSSEDFSLFDEILSSSSLSRSLKFSMSIPSLKIFNICVQFNNKHYKHSTYKIMCIFSLTYEQTLTRFKGNMRFVCPENKLFPEAERPKTRVWLESLIKCILLENPVNRCFFWIFQSFILGSIFMFIAKNANHSQTPPRILTKPSI